MRFYQCMFQRCTIASRCAHGLRSSRHCMAVRMSRSIHDRARSKTFAVGGGWLSHFFACGPRKTIAVAGGQGSVGRTVTTGRLLGKLIPVCACVGAVLAGIANIP